jgi:Fe(3+) dicitrate transport protein
MTVVIVFSLSSFSDADENIAKHWDRITVIGSKLEDGSLPGSGDRLAVEDIRNQSYDDISEILRKVPGVYLREEDGQGLFPNISLRGVDSSRSAKVTIMEDGITAAPAPYSAPEAYYSPTAGRMSAIEVLKGSSQVKYGPHTTGGVINYLSTPIPLDREIYIKTLYGSNNEIRNHTYVGDTVDTGLGRVGAVFESYYRMNDGFKTIDGSGGNTESGNTGFSRIEPMVKFSWEPDDTVNRYQRVEAKFGYTDLKANESYLGLTEEDAENNPYRRYAATRFDNIDTEEVRNYVKYITDITTNSALTLTGYYNHFHRNWFKLDSISGGPISNLSEALATGGQSLAILKGQSAGTLNVRNNNREYAQWGYKGDTSTNLELGDTTHEIEFGVGYHTDYIFRDQNTERFTQDNNGVIVSSSISNEGTAGHRREESQSVASYLKDTIEYGPLTLTPGIRYEYVDYEYIDYSTAGITPGLITAEGSNALSAVAGGIGANYAFLDQFSLFGGVHQGFSVPGPRANVRENLKEEKSLTGEIGVRFTDQNAFTGEVAYFRTDFDDLIVIDNIGGSGSGVTENVGDIITEGIELKAEYDIGKALKKEFKNPYYIALTYTNAYLDGDSNSTDPESIFSGGESGNQVPYIPEYQFAVGTGLEYKKWGLFMDATYVGETFSTASNVDNQQRPDGTPDARFGKTDEFFVIDLSGHYKITENAKAIVNLQNLFDREYIVSRHPIGPRPGTPFTFLAGMELTF